MVEIEGQGQLPNSGGTTKVFRLDGGDKAGVTNGTKDTLPILCGQWQNWGLMKSPQCESAVGSVIIKRDVHDKKKEQ